MKSLKSAVSFFRKELGFKGKTEHNGRGVYEMFISETDVTKFDIEQKIRLCVEKWTRSGMVESFEDTDEYLSVKLRDGLFEWPKGYTEEIKRIMNTRNSYRTLYFGKRFGNLGVVYTSR